MEAKPNTRATGLLQPSAVTVRVGETLTAYTYRVSSDDDGLDNVVFSLPVGAGATETVLTRRSPEQTGSSYTLVDEDEGRTVKVKVSFTDEAGHEESLTSDPTGEVKAKPNTEATGLPAIDGTEQVGETLTADTSGIDDDDGLDSAAFSYQWLRGDAEIPGATGETYTLVEADEGMTIKVKVSFTDEAGNAESLTSDPTGEVAAAEDGSRQAAGPGGRSLGAGHPPDLESACGLLRYPIRGVSGHSPERQHERTTHDALRHHRRGGRGHGLHRRRCGVGGGVPLPGGGGELRRGGQEVRLGQRTGWQLRVPAWGIFPRG